MRCHLLITHSPSGIVFLGEARIATPTGNWDGELSNPPIPLEDNLRKANSERDQTFLVGTIQEANPASSGKKIFSD